MSAVTFFEKSLEDTGHYFATVPKDKIGWKDIYKRNDGYFSFFVISNSTNLYKCLWAVIGDI